MEHGIIFYKYSTNFIYRIGVIGGIKRVPHLLTKNS